MCIFIGTSAPPIFNAVAEPSTSMGIVVPIDVTDNAVMPNSRVSSPTSISNLLEMALGSQSDPQTITDINKVTAEIPSFAGEHL